MPSTLHVPSVPLRPPAVLLSALLTLLVCHTAPACAYHTVPMNQKHLATYYVDVNLADGGDMEFLVDTGAGYTTINEDTLAVLIRANNAEYIGQLTGVMADGSEQQLPLYRIKRLVLGKDCVISDVEAAVFPQNTRMLLGLSALEKAAPFVFSTDPPLLSLSNCGNTAG